jgi:HK97 family phage portal protein
VGLRQRALAAWSVLRGTAAQVIDRAVVPANWSTFISTYGQPNAERVDPSFEQYALAGYAGNAVIFGIIDKRLKLFSEARFKYRRLADKKLFGDPSLTLLEVPWPDGATGDLLARMEQDASLAGNAYVRAVDGGDRLERLRPDWVTIVSHVTVDAFGRQVRDLLGYLYDPTGDPDRGVEFYPEDEVAHWAPIPDPLANWRGVSWLTAVLKEINADLAMTEHRDAFFRNAATPNLILKYANKLDRGQLDRIRDQVHARHGGPENAGGTLVLDMGADPMIVGAKFSDAQFSELQAAGENRIALAGGVPAIVAGLKEGLDAAAWSMFRQAMRAFADLTMRPNWRSACAALAKLVVVPDGAELWFDVSDIAALQEGEAEAAATMTQQASTASTLITAGFTPESVVTAITAADLTLLQHTGLTSVQLLPPGVAPAAASRQPDQPATKPPTKPPTEVEEPAA